MSPASILLRVFLSLSLALGGAAPAMARIGSGGAHVAAAANAHATASRTQASTQVSMPCHAHGSMAAAAIPAAAAPIAAGKHMPRHGDGCCPPGKCDCAFVQVAQLGTGTATALPGALRHPAVATRLRMGHREPLLPSLIRPPSAPAVQGA